MRIKLQLLLFTILLNFSLPLVADPLFQPNHSYGFFDFLNWSSTHPKTEPPPQPIDPNPFTQAKLVNLTNKLKDRVTGQNEAIESIVYALESYAYGLNDPNRPIASLLFMGPSGVGKTELVTSLAHNLLGSETALIRLNMGDYGAGNDIAITRLIGMARGYTNSVGGEFTDKLKKSPYGIVLLDDIDKAPLIILSLFKQIFESGYITDARGDTIDCRNYVFICTSNYESQKIITAHTLGKNQEEVLKSLQSSYASKLGNIYNLLYPCVFNTLKIEDVHQISKNILLNYITELKLKKHISLSIDPSVIEAIENNEHIPADGATKIKQFINNKVGQSIVHSISHGYLKEGDEATLYIFDEQLIIKKSDNSSPISYPWITNSFNEEINPFNLETLLTLEEELNKKVIGQSEPIRVTVASLIRYAAGIHNNNGPVASLLYLGPTGVGKTQLAKEIAIALLGDVKNLIRIDMSEYSEQYSISRLIGSPPGYVNHEEGGQLTEALKKNPFSIVLLDEIEKAHPNVLKTFLQVFDEGHITDTKGVLVDCRQAVFILTTNLGAKTILEMHSQGLLSANEILKIVQPQVINGLTPELYNRVESVAFMGLNDEAIEKLIHNMLRDMKFELLEKKNIEIECDSSVITFLKEYGFDYELGARPLKRLIQNVLVTAIAKEIIDGRINSKDKIFLSFIENELFISVESEAELLH